MKNTLLLLFCLNYSLIICSQSLFNKNGVKFVEESLSTIVQNNAESQKPIMVVVSAEYCKACERMQLEAWQNLPVSSFFNQYFTNSCIDISNENIIAKYKEFIDNMQLRILPSVYFFDSKGSFMESFSGYKEPKELLHLAESILNNSQNTN